MNNLEKQTREIEAAKQFAAVDIVIRRADMPELNRIEELIKKRKEVLKNGVN